MSQIVLSMKHRLTADTTLDRCRWTVAARGSATVRVRTHHANSNNGLPCHGKATQFVSERVAGHSVGTKCNILLAGRCRSNRIVCPTSCGLLLKNECHCSHPFAGADSPSHVGSATFHAIEYATELPGASSSIMFTRTALDLNLMMLQTMLECWGYRGQSAGQRANAN